MAGYDSVIPSEIDCYASHVMLMHNLPVEASGVLHYVLFSRRLKILLNVLVIFVLTQNKSSY